jgi:hypothetical protein
MSYKAAVSGATLASATTAVLMLLIFAANGDPHLVTRPKNGTLKATERSQATNLKHAKYVCTYGRRVHKRWACHAIGWLMRELRQTRHALYPIHDRTGYWIARQIWAANQIGSSSAGDPWPHCPDPHDGRGSWQDTVNCENGGNWMDSPGYYRCGLQFDPMWERRFGRLCP